MPKAKAAALRALELDETEPEAYTALGLIAFLYDWDWAAAERHYVRALDLDPNNPTSQPPMLICSRIPAGTAKHWPRHAVRARAEPSDADGC